MEIEFRSASGKVLEGGGCSAVPSRGR